MASLHFLYFLRLLYRFGLLLVLLGSVGYLVPPPSIAATELLSSQLERARSLAATSPSDALDLAKRVAESSQQTGDVLTERQARALIVDILRAYGSNADVAFYQEQLNRLEAIAPEDEPQRGENRALLSILRAEFALYLGDMAEAVTFGRQAVKESESLEKREIARTAKVTLGVALVKGILQDVLDESKTFRKAYGIIDPQAYDEAFTLLTKGFEDKLLEWFPYMITEGKGSLAFIHYSRGEYPKALQLYRGIEPPASAPASVRGSYLLTLSAVEGALNHQKEAEQLLNKAWDLLHEETDGTRKAQRLLASTGHYLDAGQLEKVEQAFSESADVLGKEPEGRRGILLNLNLFIIPRLEGLAESRLGSRILEKALTIPGIGDDPQVALPLYAKLGRFYADQLDYQNFKKIREKAEPAHAQSPDWRAIQDLLFQEAAIRRYQDPSGAALAYRQAVLAAMKSRDGRIDLDLYFHGLRQAINLAMEIGRYQDAVDFSLVGLTFLKPTRKDEPFEATIEFLIDTGGAMTKLGRFDLAEDALSLAIRSLPKVQADWEQRIWLAASELYSLIGDEELSLYQLNQVMTFSMSERIIHTAPDLLLQRGRVLRQLGDYLNAELALRGCISAAAGPLIRLPRAELACRWELSRFLWENLGEAREGADEAIRSFELASAKGDLFAFVEMRFLNTMRGLMQDVEPPPGIITSAQETLELLQRWPDTVRIHAYKAMLHLILVFAKKKMKSEVLDWAPFDKELHALMAEPYLAIREFDSLYLIGRALKAMGENSRALSALEELVKRVEYVRGLIADPQLEIRLGAEVNELFDEIAAIYLGQRNHEGMVKALQVAEANRARSIRHFEEIGQKTSDKDESQGTIYEQARAKLERLRKVNGYALTTEESSAATALLTLKLGTGEVLPGIQGPQFRAPMVSQSQPMQSLDIEKFRSNLSSTAVVIMYHLSGRPTGAWVITKESLRWAELGNTEKVKAGVLRFRTELLSGEPGSDQRFAQASAAAFDLLLGPLIPHIDGKNHLIIVPDASAFLIPFEALVISNGPDTRRYVIERYSITYHMSLRHLIRAKETSIHQTEKAKIVLLVGNPTFAQPAPPTPAQERTELVPLLGAQREVERIREVVGVKNVTVYLGGDARKERVLGQLSQAAIVHFATHGVVNERYPWASYLALAGENGHLTLEEVPRTPISANLVVLSACETARGRILAGEGVWGFQAQFLAAGAKNVVATLWRVEDESTAAFMEEFYKGMGSDLKEYSNSLRAAKLRLLHTDKWSHPYYWAPFVMYGRSPVAQ